MIKRPLNTRFTEAVREGRKVTTIRQKAWPVGKPIMLYNWSGAAYRSPQIDVAAVTVTATSRITIVRSEANPDVVAFLVRDTALLTSLPPLWQCEGFGSPADMQRWFSAKLKPGQTVHLHLMRFELIEPALA